MLIHPQLHARSSLHRLIILLELITRRIKPRKCVGQYDYLYNTGRGKVCPYDPEKHGEWEIYEKDGGLMGVRQTQDGIEDFDESASSTAEQSGTFALESHLRDYLAAI